VRYALAFALLLANFDRVSSRAPRLPLRSRHAKSARNGMRDTLARTSALLLGMAVLMLGAGLQATLLGVRATLEGFPTAVTGAVMAAYYVGYIGGSLAAPGLVRRVGHIRVFAALTSVAAATILTQSIFVGPWIWALLRVVSGCCFAGIYVVAESWLNDRADQRSRGTLLAVYMVLIYSGLGLGQFLLNLADPRGPLLFTLIAVLISLAVVPIALTAQRAPEFSLPHRVSFRDLFAVSPLGAAGVLVAGAISGTLFSLGAVYGAASGFDASGVALFMACSILPAVVVQLPVGRWSDRMDRRTVLVAMALLAAVAAAAAELLSPAAGWLFLLAVAAYGGLALTTYALCAAHINDHLRPEQMVAASGTVILINGAGSVLGPPLVSTAMQLTGPGAYFASLAAMHAGLALFTLWRKGRAPAVPAGAKGRFVGAAPQAAPTGRLAAPEAGQVSALDGSPTR
jgi:MFS family permease